MSTRAQIAVYEPTCKTYVTSYSHFDGYPSCLGVTLLGEYNDKDSATKLASGGSMSYPGKPHTDSRIPAKRVIGDKALSDHMQSAWADYAYRWHVGLGRWEVSRDGRIWAELGPDNIDD